MPKRRQIRGKRAVLLAWALGAAWSSAAAPPERAALVVDEAGRVLHAYDALRPHPPASLAKLATAYLVFEAIRDGSLGRDESLGVSAAAAAQPARALGLTAQSALPAETLLRATLLRSANDAAAVLGERLAGDESAFAARMTARTRALGASEITRFANASGLPASGQATTARDLAILGMAVWRDFPEWRGVFTEGEVRWRGHRAPALNGYQGRIPGADGLKTGFTCRAGYGIVATARRGGRRLFAVVLGTPTRAERDARAAALLAEAFARDPSEADGESLASLANRSDQGASLPLDGRVLARACLDPKRPVPAGWVVDLGARETEAAAREAARNAIANQPGLAGGRPHSVPRELDQLVHRIWVTHLEADAARETCRALRAADGFCVALTPRMVERAVARARSLFE